MSLLSWLRRKTARDIPSAPPAQGAASGGAPADVPGPLASARHSRPPVAPASADRLKHERTQRRELLYGVVREVMVHAGILSAGYKFKVLSLDPAGRQFLVMVDVSPDYAGYAGRWQEMEQRMAQKAKASHGIQVTAVYWRVSETVVAVSKRPATAEVSVQVPAQTAVSDPLPHPLLASGAKGAGVSPLSTPVARSAAPTSTPAVARPRPVSVFDPIEADEVAAFQRALATSSAEEKSPRNETVPPSGTVGFTPLAPSGFADTEVDEEAAARRGNPELGSTQYGDLR